METALTIVLTSFFISCVGFLLVVMISAKRRQRRTARIMQEMMEEYEQVYQRSPDDFLRDNIIEFQHYKWAKMSDKNTEKP